MTAVAVARLRVSIARARPPLAILYGLGAYWIVASLVIGLLVTASFFVRLPVNSLYLPTAAFAASAAAVAVALRSGGWVSAGGLAVAAVMYRLFLDCWSNGPALGTCAVDLARIVRGHVGEVVGGLVGLPLALGVRPRDGRSALLLAAGIFAIALPVLLVAVAPTGPGHGIGRTRTVSLDDPRTGWGRHRRRSRSRRDREASDLGTADHRSRSPAPVARRDVPAVVAGPSGARGQPGPGRDRPDAVAVLPASRLLRTGAHRIRRGARRRGAD